jgi:hypothetical protein
MHWKIQQPVRKRYGRKYDTTAPPPANNRDAAENR